jgi:hypothetical protein
MDGEEVAESSQSKSSKKKKAKKDKKSKKKDAKKSKSRKSKKKARDEEEEELDDEAAGDEEESDAADAAVPNATPGVAEALGKFKVFNGKPNLKAEYYIYLYSASWCGYCQQCMPIAVAEYNKMKLNPNAPEYRNNTPIILSFRCKASINLTCEGNVPTIGTTIVKIAIA